MEVTAQLRLRDQMYADQQTGQWKLQYIIRAGIEATMSELKRSHGMGKLRVRKASKVCFAVACKVIACNINRWARAAATSIGALRYFYCQILAIISPVDLFKEQFITDSTDSKFIFQEVICVSGTGT